MSINPNEIDIKRIIENYNSQRGNSMEDRIPTVSQMVEVSGQILQEEAERSVPENGKFSPVTINFKIPNTNNEGILYINYDGDEPDTQRYLSLGVHHESRDRLVSNIIIKGTKQEILEYLNFKKNIDELAEIAKKLSDNTDEYYSSL